MSILIPVTQTAENLRAVAKELSESSSKIAALAEKVAGSNIPAVDITHHGQLQNALDFVDNYCSAGAKAIRKVMKDRGDFGTNAEKKARKKPKKQIDK